MDWRNHIPNDEVGCLSVARGKEHFEHTVKCSHFSSCVMYIY